MCPFSHSYVGVGEDQVNAYLVIEDGVRAGSRFFLRDQSPNMIGRETSSCEIVLNDVHCSRNHAVIWKEGGSWWVEDKGSSNGTYVNGQKIDQAQIADGNRLTVGQTHFVVRFVPDFIESPTSVENYTPTIIYEESVNPDETGQYFLSQLDGVSSGRTLYHMFRLSFRFLECDDPEEIVRESMEFLLNQTNASLVSFLWADDEGNLRPKAIVPEHLAHKVEINELINRLVSREQHSIRVDLVAPSNPGSAGQFADTICAPLVYNNETKGGLYLFREKGRFENEHYQLCRALANVIARALVKVRRQSILQLDHERLRRKLGEFDELVGESRPMEELKNRIRRVSRATGCVLIRGESGSGKELVARALHQASMRRDRPMLSVNCAAIPDDLMESQLFGHKKGAFTSADNDHIGYFQQADAGTLFLDEIGELTLEGQAKLLRILEGHPFLPVGGTKEVSVDVRVIAATNRELREYVEDKRFREDLYYRLCVFEMHVPPLRERGSDIELLVNHFLDHFTRQHGRSGLKLSPEARDRLLSYQWPGNVRQLRNVMDSAVVMAEGDTILPDDLPLRGSSNSGFESLRIDFWERKLIQEALSRTSGNVPDAAKLLGLSRATLYRKVEDYGIAR